MRYIKTLLLACLFFVLLVFFFQNQTVLAQELQLSLNLFFLSAMSSIKLPFYFLILAAFFLGVLLSLSLLVWDKINLTAKLMKNNWRIKNLQSEVEKLQKQLGSNDKTAFSENNRETYTLKKVSGSDDVLTKESNGNQTEKNETAN